MSSSPSRAPVPPEAVRPPKIHPEAVPFFYEEVAAKSAGQNARRGSLASANAPSQTPAQSPERDAQLREAGRQQGFSEAGAKYEEAVVRERSAVSAAIAAFERERSTYYRKIEAQTVQLALAIARKVLHREAQVDPLLLMGIARVALDKVDGATEVKLALHPGQAQDWRSQLASWQAAVPEKKNLVEVVEDPAIPPGQCELRTSMGSTQLGVEVQLKEIEQGLADLVAARPSPSL